MKNQEVILKSARLTHAFGRAKQGSSVVGNHYVSLVGSLKSVCILIIIPRLHIIASEFHYVNHTVGLKSGQGQAAYQNRHVPHDKGGDDLLLTFTRFIVFPYVGCPY